jgi:hypothetical protein
MHLLFLLQSGGWGCVPARARARAYTHTHTHTYTETHTVTKYKSPHLQHSKSRYEA